MTESVLAFEEVQREVECQESSLSQSSSYGLKLVPWICWDEWLFVYDSLFSDSHEAFASAFRKISTWRSRGCLPVTVDVTASIIEIQQKDPYFRKGQDIATSVEDGANQCVNVSLSDEMLAMLYSMAIMRLVNGVIEKTRKKQEVSIAVAANAIGMPRTLIDIRHEGSHRELPALQIVRGASITALDWLKSYYWEPQKKAIPFQGDSTTKIRKRIKSKLHELAFCLNAKESLQSSSSPLKGKRGRNFNLLCGRNKFLSLATGELRSSKSEGNKKQITKVIKHLVGLFSSCSSEVVSALLDLLLMALSSSHSMEPSVDAEIGPSTETLLDEWKLPIKKISNKEPEVLAALLKEVLDVIESHENMKYETGTECLTLSDNGRDVRRVEYLASLFAWLVQILKELKPRRHKDSAAKTKSSSAESTISKALLMQLLRKCLALSAPGNKHLMDSALYITQLIGCNHLMKKLNKLSSLVSSNSEIIEDKSSLFNSKSLIQRDESISQAAKKLELIKHLRMKRKVANAADDDMGNSRRWAVSTSWIPCPIGMLPNSVGSSGCLPVLDCKGDQKKNSETQQARENLEFNCYSEAIGPTPALLDGSGVKKRRLTVEGDFESNRGEDVSILEGLDGQLMIGGVWKTVGEEDILDIKSSVRILV
ncbi:pre-rRNA-processing protein las1 isoform X2 [Morus notabilis]|uniref:pre-rRNA-processing protein las1 isoform X2 n=1 Tax=Morus notabilis TaxID=981085 RepID=UPI000CED2FEF|nr:pre-rRNA-processing protein las1 isoform X2 [Morus notabilis]